MENYLLEEDHTLFRYISVRMSNRHCILQDFPPDKKINDRLILVLNPHSYRRW